MHNYLYIWHTLCSHARRVSVTVVHGKIMYGAVRKYFPNCLDIVSDKILELKILFVSSRSFLRK